MDISEARRILRERPSMDTIRIVPRPSEQMEKLTNPQTIDSILAQIKAYEHQKENNGHIVGVAEIQSARGSWYCVTTADEAVPGRKLGNFDRYIKFWPKSYFLELKKF